MLDLVIDLNDAILMDLMFAQKVIW